MEAGVPLSKMVMAVAYGDELTNMLQPFWALPLLAITGVKARDIVGYTAVRHPLLLGELECIKPTLTGGVIALVAGCVGPVRLIDNMLLGPDSGK